MVVDKYVGRCLDVGSTPTGSIIPLHSFAFLGKTLLNQRFLFLSLVFLGILLRKKDTTKDTTFLSYPRNLCTSQSVLQLYYKRLRNGSIIFVVGKSPMDIMEPILL